MQLLDRERTLSHLEQTGIDRPGANAFGYRDELRSVQYNWHSHSYHQLLYAFRGTAYVEVGQARYVLPPQRAAWISARTPHRTTLHQVEGGSVFLHPKLVNWPVEPVRIIAAQPLLREMVKEAARWHAKDGSKNEFRTSYFRALVHLCREWLRDDMPFWLPSSADPQLARAIDYTLSDLANATAVEAARQAAMSTRSFRRRFTADLGLTWRDYLVKARLLRSLELLGRPTASVADVALQIGFESPSAFSKAFHRFTAERPTDYRKRISREFDHKLS